MPAALEIGRCDGAGLDRAAGCPQAFAPACQCVVSLGLTLLSLWRSPGLPTFPNPARQSTPVAAPGCAVAIDSNSQGIILGPSIALGTRRTMLARLVALQADAAPFKRPGCHDMARSLPYRFRSIRARVCLAHDQRLESKGLP